MVKKIILLGNPKLYQISSIIEKDEMDIIKELVIDLHDTLMNFRNKYGVGRAIASPQIGVFKRLIYMNIDKPVVFINPILIFEDDEFMEVIDDCMSFPELLVKVKRHCRCTIHFKDIDFIDNEMKLEGDLSELLQHEYDHLDGIIATMRAIDDKSLCLKSEKHFLEE
ncbi:peptide deformylase [Clostridium estertheticum]|uniref:peptide deformylase n=1 Tax=Clostridium estertheticum TaxID=238834 RepID=UPI001CF28F7A|nr:peptide deformylase [Clostridium estertheticum]MCB2354211.1 peptide deformylase [Clostridium estertheticum]MCB2359747.1 peptide deformylase [Clostridium estertheticum]WAG42665.1 peptide deformylase [Clostridium estertheticum]